MSLLAQAKGESETGKVSRGNDESHRGEEGGFAGLIAGAVPSSRACPSASAGIERTVRSLHLPRATVDQSPHETIMSKLLRGVAAGYGAKKLGGGCFSTVIVFLILWWLLGHFGIFK